jgi:hypothetical protein
MLAICGIKKPSLFGKLGHQAMGIIFITNLDNP